MYYEVLARLHSYHGSEYLTYSSDNAIAIGQVVRIHIRNRIALAIVMRQVRQPSFATKPIDEILLLAPLPATTLSLIAWLQSYYPAPLGLLAQLFLPVSLPKKIPSIAYSKTTFKTAPLPKLTLGQQRVIKELETRATSTSLLHGDTGTGKTRIYIDLATKQLKRNKSVLILTPEIALTPQLVGEVQTGLPGALVLVMHSSLTDAQRREVWLEVLRSQEPVVVIGPRSALFVPFHKLGLIVVDEFHEPAYKQEQAPYYQTVRVAAQLARLHKAQLILGSATPPVVEYFVAQAKNVPITRLTEIATGKPQPVDIQLVDLRDKAKLTRHPHLSNLLLEKIETALKRGEQSLIFLNRRGTARLVLCEQCGWQALCPRCDLPLTYHGDNHLMRCHVCGYHAKTPTQCPVCGGGELVFKGIGTKSITESLQHLFPKARIQRFDSDSSKDERFEQHYVNVKAGEVDIIVGTQLLAKGLDLPHLSVVGVVLADSSLYVPDYTAEERTFQLLNQVMGRVGRGHRASSIVIQSYRPDGPAMRAAITKQWDAFYKEQLKEREAFLFPPFCFLMKLSCKRASRASAQKVSEELAESLKSLKKPLQIVGPSPAFHEKNSGRYEWQLIVKARERKQLIELIKHIPPNWTYDLDPSNLL